MADEDRKDDLEDMLLEPSFSDMRKGRENSDIGSSEKKSKAAIMAGVFKTRKMQLILLAGGIMIVVLLVATFIISPGKGDGSGEQVMAESASDEGAQNLSGHENQIVFEDIVELEPFERIHLKTNSTMGLITLGLALELTDSRHRKQIHLQEDRIRQVVTNRVGEMTWLELRNPDGKIRLKYELLKRINSLYPRTTVRNIYYTYFMMQ